MNWISVKERLPDEDEPVLTCIAGGTIHSMKVVPFGYGKENTPTWFDDNGWEDVADSEITHWMPLPNPPTHPEAKMTHKHQISEREK